MAPDSFRPDTDHFISTSAADPQVPFVYQGWWGSDDARWGGKCGRDHCCLEGNVTGTLPFPHDRVVSPAGSPTFGDNNAAALLLPDNVTLVQFQPLYRCVAGGPLTSLTYTMHQPWSNVSILDAVNASYGAHGGSGLSSIGGTIRGRRHWTPTHTSQQSFDTLPIVRTPLSGAMQEETTRRLPVVRVLFHTLWKGL